MEQLHQEMDQVGLDDKRVDIQSYDRYKGRKGVTDRIALISPVLLRVRVHYNRVKKKTFQCLSTPTLQQVCCTVMQDPEQRFGVVLFHYTTDADGNLLVEDKLTGKVKLWIWSESRYSELSQVHRQFPLLAVDFASPQMDLMCKCTEEGFQKMVFTPCRDAFWKKKKEWYDFLMKKEGKAKPRLQKAMGVTLTLEEVKALLEIDAPVSANPSAGDVALDINDILDTGTEEAVKEAVVEGGTVAPAADILA